MITTKLSGKGFSQLRVILDYIYKNEKKPSAKEIADRLSNNCYQTFTQSAVEAWLKKGRNIAESAISCFCQTFNLDEERFRTLDDGSDIYKNIIASHVDIDDIKIKNETIDKLVADDKWDFRAEIHDEALVKYTNYLRDQFPMIRETSLLNYKNRDTKEFLDGERVNIQVSAEFNSEFMFLYIVGIDYMGKEKLIYPNIEKNEDNKIFKNKEKFISSSLNMNKISQEERKERASLMFFITSSKLCFCNMIEKGICIQKRNLINYDVERYGTLIKCIEDLIKESNMKYGRKVRDYIVKES